MSNSYQNKSTERNYLYIHKDTSISDIYQLIKTPESLVYLWNTKDLLNHSKDGVKNIELVWASYPVELKTKDLEEFYLKDLENLSNPNYKGTYIITKLYKGTKLYFPESKWNYEVLISEGNLVQTDSFNVFLNKRLENLINDPKYYPISKTNLGDGLTKLINTSPKQTVWLWCKGLTKFNDLQSSNKENSYSTSNGTLEEGTTITFVNDNTSNVKGGFINLTPYIKSLTTSSSKEGGTFMLNLPSIIVYYDKKLGWVLGDQRLQFDESFVSMNNLYTIKNGVKTRNFFFFDKVISENDLIYIRFETLNNELPGRIKDIYKEITSSDLPSIGNEKKIYDMIGLVDTVSSSTSFRNGFNSEIIITGRDFNKIFIEDGCFFYPGDFIPGGLVGNHTNSQKLTRFEGKIMNLLQGSQKSIEYCLKFILNSLSNIEVVPDEVFQYYENKSKRFILELERREDKKFILEEKKQLVIEEIKSCRALDMMEDFLNDENNGIAERIFNDWYSFLNDAKKQGKLDLSTNPYKITNDFLYKGVTHNNTTSIPDEVGELLVNDPNNNRFFTSSFLFMTDYINYENQYKNNKTSEYQEENSKGIYQIIELVLDDSIRNRRLVDSSIGNEMGSIRNYLDKVCQEPFVELYTDTVEDRFVIAARKPPFDKKSVIDYIDNFIIGKEVNTIKAEDVFDENLTNTISQAYSWYRIIPQGNLPGSSQNITFAFIKALHFPEYARVFGEKPLEIVSNYLSSFYPSGREEDTWLNNILTQLVLDLKYLVESNSYLPFTRQGQIVIRGERRIKKGIWIYYEPTNEYFYVDAVVNSYSKDNQGGISRETILSVSRGMLKPFVEGVNVPNIGKVSYFNIINGCYEDIRFEYEDIEKEEIIEIKTVKNVNKNKNEINTSKEEKSQNITKVTNKIPIQKKTFSNQNEIFFCIMEKNKPEEQNNINTLREFVWRVEKELGWSVIITDGFRTFEEQIKRVNKNRNLGRAAAAPGSSRHEKGNAIDINAIKTINNKKQYLRYKSSKKDWLDSGIPNLAKEMGLNWGGDFGDNVHFSTGSPEKGNVKNSNLKSQSLENVTSNEDVEFEEIITETQSKIINTKKLKIENILSNFYVNEKIFNFFLTKQHFGYLNDYL